ncbi:hypothetical protein CC86DRAFT_401519 [Ophiobolus disseminans]|uniref:F-box domain-containing protein n=1 Tax=Ophiobolus disseminans TaxID=1469910 RepID=A0A6A7ADK7_9PLEO|nr:hypothetical protein CC86DRAFT_401519 [Ophiobolus disseminans]
MRLRNKLDSPFLRLPGELRNRIYELVAASTKRSIFSKEIGPDPSALNLSMVCYQIHHEMDLLPYSEMILSIYSSSMFRTWLCKRTPRQLATIKTFTMYGLLMLDGLRDYHDMRMHRTASLKFDDWPNLPNLEGAHACLIPYYRDGKIDPLESKNRALWDRRAQTAADAIVGNVQQLYGHIINITGEWLRPLEGTARKIVEECISKSGLVWDDVNNLWVLSLPAPGKDYRW